MFRVLIVWLGLCCIVELRAQDKKPAKPDAKPDTTKSQAGDVQTIVIPIHGVIGVTTAAIVRRGYAEARAHGAARVLLDIDTPGGLIAEMREVESVLAQIRAEGMHTAAYVRRQALSAGAYLALACRDVFVAPGATLGAITPVLGDPITGGTVEIPDDDARKKAYAAMRADVRALLEQRGGASRDLLKVGQAMVDPTLRLFSVRYVDGSGLVVNELMFEDDLRNITSASLKIQSQRELGSRPLVLTAEDALRLNVAKGSAASIDDLLRDEYLTTQATTLTMEENWSESAVVWLDAMKPVLFLLGFLLLLIEMKTPGFLVPGVLGVALLGLAMFGSYLVGLADVTEILLLFLGLVALAVEIFFLPGTVIFGAVGLVSIVAAIILSQQTFVLPSNDAETQLLSRNLLNLLLVTVGVMVTFWSYVRLLPRIPFMNRVLLVPPTLPPIGADSTNTAAAALIGRVGVAATDLRPSGIVELADGARYDAVTRGDFIGAGSDVRVLDQAYQQLVVERVAKQPAAERGQVSLGVLFLLTVIGLVLIVAEVFFISLGALGGMAALTLLSAIVLAFTHHGQVVGFLFLGLAALGAPTVAFFALRMLPKTKFGKQLILEAPRPDEISGAALPELLALVRQAGIAETTLRPAGIARLAGRRVDVVTRGELIEAGCPVTVLSVEGSRVVVAESRTALHSASNPTS